MNDDQIKGAMKNSAGKFQQEVGKALGSEKQEVKGLKKQAEGKLQKSAGDIRKTLKDIVEGE